MSVLRSIESKLESLFEGVFGRAFRANVQPVEIARKLVKEMDEHRSVSVSRVYVPNEYTVYLSPVDRDQFAGYEDQLCEELQDYLAEHSRRERYVLLSPPLVKLDTDADLEKGMFGIATRLARVPAEAPRRQPEPSPTVIYKPVELPQPAAVVLEEEPARELAVLVIGEQRHELGEQSVVLGRSRDCDIQLMDPNASRRHAEIRAEGGTYTVVDLGSTNGIEVNGSRVKELVLENGSRFTIGSTEILFSRETR
jgi:pSer/pThr/pTyr-binding forkhead associated (FHA) protein